MGLVAKRQSKKRQNGVIRMALNESIKGEVKNNGYYHRWIEA